MGHGSLKRILVALSLSASAVLVAAGPSAAAKPTILSTFDTGLGELVAIALDPVSGNLFIHGGHTADIIEYTPSGSVVAPNIPRPGASSNDFDLDFASEALTLANTAVPANSLLAVNGDNGPETVYALNKDNGSILASAGPIASIDPVGLAYHTGRDTLFYLDYGSDQLVEVRPSDGVELNRFSLTPPGSDPYDVFYGDVDVDEATGNLIVVSSVRSTIRELTPTGAFVKDTDISTLGLGGLSGVAVDPGGDLWVTTLSSGGTVAHIHIPQGEDRPPAECTQDPNAVCGGADDENLDGTPESDFMFGGGGNDNIGGGDGDDTLLGASGTDSLTGGGGADELEGGTGNDTLIGDLPTVGRQADEPGADVLDGGAGSDTVDGGGGADEANGGGGADEITGGDGDDVLKGSGGNDFIKSGPGKNKVVGGPGKDKCVVGKNDSVSSCEEIRRRNF